MWLLCFFYSGLSVPTPLRCIYCLFQNSLRLIKGLSPLFGCFCPTPRKGIFQNSQTYIVLNMIQGLKISFVFLDSSVKRVAFHAYSFHGFYSRDFVLFPFGIDSFKGIINLVFLSAEFNAVLPSYSNPFFLSFPCSFAFVLGHITQ